MAIDLNLTTSTFGEIKNEKYQLVVLPWGATEPHNLHLPYLTDCLLSQAIALDTARRVQGAYEINCMVMPPVNYGAQNPGQWQQPFCIHTRYTTQYAILSDIVASLYYQGFRRMVIINGHGGNTFKPMIRDLAVDYPDFLIAIADWFGIVPQKGFFDHIDDHAGEMETSVLMHYYPEMIDLSKAGDGIGHPFAMESLNQKTAWLPRHWNLATEDTGIGNPHASTAAKGARYAEAVVGRLETLFVELATKDLY